MRRGSFPRISFPATPSASFSIASLAVLIVFALLEIDGDELRSRPPFERRCALTR